MQQLLLIETVVKLAAGIVLVLAPLATAAVLGLPRPPTGFWPRLLGAVLIALAAALFIEARLPGSKGLGLAGVIAVNLIAAFIMIAQLLAKAGAETRRGKLAMWLCAAALVVLALVEIAYA